MPTVWVGNWIRAIETDVAQQPPLRSSPESFSQLFTRTTSTCGLPRIRFHDLRHTHASLLVAAGVPMKVVSEWLGHAHPGFTSAKVIQARGRSTGPRRMSLRIRTPDGEGTDFDIVTKRSLNPMQAEQILGADDLEPTTLLRGPKPVDLVVIAPYLSERTREVITARGVSYIDSTGNVRLQSDTPALYILTSGAVKTRGQRTNHSSRYAAAARRERCAPWSTSVRPTGCENSLAEPTSRLRRLRE